MLLDCLKSRALLVIIVYTNFMDYMLMSAVVPIIPNFLLEADKMDSVVNALDNSTALNITDILDLFNGTTSNETIPEKTFIEKVLHIPVRAINENSKVGWLLGSKALVQMVANPVVGYLSNRVSYRNILMFGTIVLLATSTNFAFAESYILLLISRASHGIGSAATSVAGMSLIAEGYPGDTERSRAMGTAMSGYAVGILVGCPFGGLLYALSGKTAPFVGIAVLCLSNIGLQLWFLSDFVGSNQQQLKTTYLHKLLADPYILTCAGALMVTTMSLATLESTVPIWVMDTMDAKQWQLGLIFIPDSSGYFLGTNLFPVIAQKYGRWIFTIGSMLLLGIGMFVIPFCTKLGHILIPHLSVGLGIGITDAAVMPLLALLVDQRHVATYGSVYAIVQLAICLGNFLGPALAGQMVKTVGFKWSMWGMAIFNILYSPLCVLLKSPPVAEDAQCILQEFKQDEVRRENNIDTGTKYRTVNLE